LCMALEADATKLYTGDIRYHNDVLT
jgi:hypothetical protein